MFSSGYRMLLAVLLVAGIANTAVAGPSAESLINDRIDKLRQIPDEKRPQAIAQQVAGLAADIGALPAGQGKVKLADTLAHLVTPGDPGKETLQAAADTLAKSLTETPQPAKNDKPAEPYMELAMLARYEGVSTTLKDPQLAKADEILVANDADVQKADFTLKDLNGKKVTLSALHGQIVLVSFWGTECEPCRKEMADLDLIYTHFQAQGLAILSVANENEFRIGTFLRKNPGVYHPSVLADADGKVTKQFHVDTLPRAFVFDRDGKLVAQSMDMRTQHQLLLMLAKAGLHP